MTETTKEKKPLRLSKSGRLEMKKPSSSSGSVRQSFSHGRSKTVTVEVKKKRVSTQIKKTGNKNLKPKENVDRTYVIDNSNERILSPKDDGGSKARVVLKALTADEKVARARALEDSNKASALARKQAEEKASQQLKEEEQVAAERAAATKRETEELERKRGEEEARRKAAAAAARRLGDGDTVEVDDDDRKQDGQRRKRPGRGEQRRAAPKQRGAGDRRRVGKVTISQALDDRERTRSLASVKRRREREKRQAREESNLETPSKVYRDVAIPDSISVQELANRMTERAAEVIKALMKMGVMVTITQSIDADTAELVVEEFGHRPKRISESDVEIGFLTGNEDEDSVKVPRPPIVSVMGHVDHGKTSLLDALYKSDIAGNEAGGITQHIGAYQVILPSGEPATFLDTPGHEAFTSIRARGVQVTDLVVLVVAADDGVMPQTVEAIKHAKAAETPIIVAVNKIDKAGSDVSRVKQALLQHEVVVEEMGGDVLCVEISALQKTGLDKLGEAISLQAEILDLKANADRAAEGVIIEAKLEQGRGSVVTALVMRGKLTVGNSLVAGSEWGKVRALLDDRGNPTEEILPGQPAEVLGLTGTPVAGDEFGVVENETRAKEIAAFRKSEIRKNEYTGGILKHSSVEQLFSKMEKENIRELPLILKADVHGSLEAIQAALGKLSTPEITTKVLHGAVGGINQSDVSLAKASDAAIVGFNVRANAQAREKAKVDGTIIKYYTVIYELIEEIKLILSGMLDPLIKENVLGQARVKEIFSVSKLGRIAGCEVTDGLVRRYAKVRLLRDDIVLHESNIETLKHFKDDTNEVKSGSDCGISIANYQDVQKGDVLEVFETEEVSRSL